MGKTARFIARDLGRYDPDSLRGYGSVSGFRVLRKALTMGGCNTADMLATNGAQDRGNAAYDMGKRWRQVREVPGAHKCMIYNVDKDEPDIFRDRGLFTHNPSQLLGGIIIAGWVVRMNNRCVYLREEYSHPRPQLLSAVTQCEATDYLGKNILSSGLNYRIYLYSDAGAYACGGGSALVESVDGHADRPQIKFPFIKQCGMSHLLTCISNVEPLSLVAPPLLGDEDYYRSQGTPDCPGTKTTSICGNVEHPGVFEVPLGIIIREIAYDLASGVENEDYPLHLVQLDGALGHICSPAQLDTPHTYKDIRQADLTAIGSGVMLVVDERTSAIDSLRMTQEFFSYENYGQCIPYREDSRHISLLLDKMAESTHTTQDITTPKKPANIMSSTSLCSLGETAQSTPLSCMKRFPEVPAVEGEVAVR